DVVKILYVIGTLEIGGSERQLVSLVKGLDRSKFSPAVFCLTAQGPLVAELSRAGIKVECFGLRGLRVLRNPGAIARRLLAFSLALRHEQPAIVHGFLFHAYVLGTVAAKLAGVPIVITSRRSLGHFKAKRPHYRIAERLANRMTDLVIANSEAVKQ